MKTLLYWVRFVLIYGLTIQAVWAQTAQKIQIIDQQNTKPIDGVTYYYGSQKGVSDDQGYIIIILQEGEKLYISHLNYGTLAFSQDDVLSILAAGQLSLTEQTMQLQPVNIIARRNYLDKPGDLTFDEQDFLTHDAATILTDLPEIAAIRKSGSYGFDPVLRGFKYEQINIVIDGALSAIAACPNRMDPPASQVAPNMMAEVEVLKGPHNLRFGSNFGGTINFKSPSSLFTAEPGLVGRLSAGYESNGNIYRTEGMFGHQGKGHDLKFYGAWSAGDDYTDGNGKPVSAAFQRSSFGTRLGFELSKKQELALSVNANIARDVDFAALAMDLRSDDTWLLKMDHRIDFEGRQLKSWQTNVYGSFVNHVMDNLSKPLDPRMVNAVTNATTQTMGARTEGNFAMANTNLYLGADIKHESAQGERSREFLMGPNAGNTLVDNVWQDGKILKAAAFGEYERSFDNWQLIFSSRLESNMADLGAAAPEFTNEYSSTVSNQFNVSASLGGLRKLGNHFSTGLWVGRASRSGSLTERFINYFPVGLDPYEMLGNPDLKAEVNYQADLNFTYRNKTMALSLDGFTAVLNNYISSIIRPDLSPRIPSSPGVRQFINLDQALMVGGELSWNQYLFAGLSHQLNLAYTWGRDQETTDPLPEIAPFDLRYKLKGLYLNDKLSAAAGLRYVAEQNRIATNFGETETPAFAIVDLELGYRITSMLGLQLGVNNLFDQAYYEHLSRRVSGTPPTRILSPGRNVFLTLVFDYQ